MSGIVFAAIAPHGFSIIEEIAGSDLELFKPIRDGMKLFQEKINYHAIDTIVVLTPHGLKITGHNAIYLTERCSGTLSQYGKSVSLEYLCDRELAHAILKTAEENNINLVGCNYGAMSGEFSILPMDWGVLIPLWFCKNEVKPKLVVISPSRDIPFEELIVLGKVIATVAKLSDKRVALIASADQGHCHDINGPYGYAKESKVIDDIIVNIVKEDRLCEMTQINKDLIHKGKPDSIWQMLILQGALEITPLKGSFITYQVPTYFGMMVATYE